MLPQILPAKSTNAYSLPYFAKQKCNVSVAYNSKTAPVFKWESVFQLSDYLFGTTFICSPYLFSVLVTLANNNTWEGDLGLLLLWSLSDMTNGRAQQWMSAPGAQQVTLSLRPALASAGSAHSLFVDGLWEGRSANIAAPFATGGDEIKIDLSTLLV